MEDRLSNLRLKRQSLFNSHRQSRWINSDLDSLFIKHRLLSKSLKEFLNMQKKWAAQKDRPWTGGKLKMAKDPA
jgi:hypothetical protein